MIRSILQSIGRKHMDVSMRTGEGFVVRIIEAPGMWMTPDALEALSADLRQIAARTLANDALAYGVFSGDPAVMGNVIITLVRRTDGTPVAFNALTVMEVDTDPAPTEVLHLGLVMVDPDERSKNLSWVLYGLTCFLIFLRRQLRPVWVSNVTQVPSVAGMVAEMFSDVWPRPEAGSRRIRHLLLAREIMAAHRHVFGVGSEAGFDEERFVITDAYTGGSDALKKTWDNAPKHRDEVYNRFCADVLDYQRGDDLLQLGKMDMAAMRRYLAREVPRGAVAGLLVTGLVVMMQRLVMPVFYWLDAGRTWSILRPDGRRSQ